LFPSDGPIDAVDRRDAEAIAFAVAGLWILGCSIPGLTATAESMISPLHKIGDYEHVQIPWKSALAHAAQALVGLVFFFQAVRVPGWWDGRLIRQRGRDASHVAYPAAAADSLRSAALAAEPQAVRRIRMRFRDWPAWLIALVSLGWVVLSIGGTALWMV